MMSGIPSAIGGALAVSGVDVARQKKKKKELEDKNRGDKLLKADFYVDS